MSTDLDVSARPVAHLPLVRAIVEQLGILDVVDELCPKHPLNRVSDAECVLSMVYNVLSGRPALYRMQDWIGLLDAEVLFGAGADPAAFHDTRLADALDHLDEVGTDNVLSRVVTKFLHHPDQPRAFSVHHDTTSVVLYGAYNGVADPRPAYGFSKDHRPDLKQLIFGLTLHGAAGIPLVTSIQAGNTADSSVARDHLAKLTKLLPDEHEVTFVGDCKLVDPTTLGRILAAGLHFVSLVPDSYKLRRDLIEGMFAEHPDPAHWPLLAEKPGRRKEHELSAYRGRSTIRPFRTMLEDEHGIGPESQEDLKFLVVHSDVLAAKFDRGLADRMAKEVKALDKSAKKLNRKGFDCEADARAAGDVLQAGAKFHLVAVTVVEEEEPIKRSGPGRPRNGDAATTRRVWRVQAAYTADDAGIASTRNRAGCFVLVTDWLDDWSDERILAEYRHQYIVEGHTGFRWLEGPAAVAPVFLKTPARIRAMGLVLVLALMVRNYIQATMRRTLRERGETVPHPFTKKPEANLTTEMAFEHFAGIQAIVVRTPDGVTRLPVRIGPVATRLLALFGLNAAAFQPPTRRSRRISSPRLGGTPGM